MKKPFVLKKSSPGTPPPEESTPLENVPRKYPEPPVYKSNKFTLESLTAEMKNSKCTNSPQRVLLRRGNSTTQNSTPQVLALDTTMNGSFSSPRDGSGGNTPRDGRENGSILFAKTDHIEPKRKISVGPSIFSDITTTISDISDDELSRNSDADTPRKSHSGYDLSRRKKLVVLQSTISKNWRYQLEYMRTDGNNTRIIPEWEMIVKMKDLEEKL